ncbi:MAG: hypothetical protein Q9187_000292 [Circinaria calcarea]
MVKHTLDNVEENRDVKRRRCEDIDRLSRLSDELLLRALSFLPVPALTVCQRLSHRFHVLAGDPQLWKSAYYSRFVRPRASRIPGIRDQDVPAASLLYSSRLSKWLEDEHLVRRGTKTNWKKQYKLRHNWSKGSCSVREVEIARRPTIPAILVQLHGDVVVTVDQAQGLRAWSLKGEHRLLARLDLHSGCLDCPTSVVPTSLALDDSRGGFALSISVGFSDGGFGIYTLRSQEQNISCRYAHAASTNGAITAIAYASPYLVTMTDAQLLSLYSFSLDSPYDQLDSVLDPPRLLSSLKSHTSWPPLSISLRASSAAIVASIAYALPTYLSGWSVGLQELRLTPNGNITQSRLTSAMDQGFTPLSSTSSNYSSPRSGLDSSPVSGNEDAALPILTKPTSLSYSHPYLLASHPDNTLTLYLVSSSEKELTIGHGARLWGHTSSVSGAHVGDRGKAVSVSLHGDEIRVWELEGGITSRSSKRRMAAGQASVQVQPERKQHERVNGELFEHRSRDIADAQRRPRHGFDGLEATKGWVGFDEEKVIVLQEKDYGTQALVVYDFS